MAELVWISGASSGIGQALVQSVPWPDARVIGISRRPVPGIEHLALDLSEPSSWSLLGASFERELAGFAGSRVVFIHAAGTLEPMGFAGYLDSAAYRANVLLNSASPQVLGDLFLSAFGRSASAERGDLVMITSGAARSVYPGWTSYGAAKAAVDQWVRAAGAEQDRRSQAGVAAGAEQDRRSQAGVAAGAEQDRRSQAGVAAGAEQEQRSQAGVQVMAVAPGTVDTGMQALIRSTPEDDFPQRQKFLDLHAAGKLASPKEVAVKMWRLLDAGLPNGSVIDLRDLPA